MKVEIEIADQDIIDVLCTALEGGSNYWYNIPDMTMVRKHFGKDSGLAGSEKVGKAVLEHGAIVPVYDIEDEDNRLGEISKDNIARGLKMYCENGGLWDGSMDAGEADSFFQYVVMGEIVYG